MAISYGPNNDVRNYVPTQQHLGNKTLFTTSVKNGDTTVRYFSGTDAEIYFDEVYIDEVVQIQFQLQQNTMPLFGYNSYVYDQVARGSRLINGSFTINFTQANYLYDVLNVLSEKPLSNNATVSKDNEGTVDDFDDANRYTADSNTSTLSMNNVKGPVWNRSFEIIMSYGDAKQKVANSTMLTLTGVVLTGCSQVLGINGEPIYETYNFIARDITSPAAIENKTASKVAATTTEKEEASITITDITYNEYIDERTYKPAGTLKLSYKSSYPIEEVSMQLMIPLNSDVGMIKLVDNLVVDVNTITYRVPQGWRDGIKKYCANGGTALTDLNSQLIFGPLNPLDMLNTSNKTNIPSTLNVSMVFSYTVNGETSTKVVPGKLKLETVYTEK